MDRSGRVEGWYKEVLGIVATLFAPIHLREALAAGEGSLTYTWHGILTFGGALCYLLAMGFGATVFGKRFRLYSIATMLILVVFGVLTGLDQPRLEANLPTPWMGFGSASTSSPPCFGSRCWPSLSYSPAGISNLALTRIADRSVVLPRLRDSILHERHVEPGERVSGLESLDVPELDHLLLLLEVVVQQLRKEDRAVLTAGEREPAYDQPVMIAVRSSG